MHTHYLDTKLKIHKFAELISILNPKRGPREQKSAGQTFVDCEFFWSRWFTFYAINKHWGGGGYISKWQLRQKMTFFWKIAIV